MEYYVAFQNNDIENKLTYISQFFYNIQLLL